jgi:hypothetical protein
VRILNFAIWLHRTVSQFFPLTPINLFGEIDSALSLVCCAVWFRAKQLISNATEIHVIGYSFSGIDRGPMLEMLGQARRERTDSNHDS